MRDTSSLTFDDISKWARSGFLNGRSENATKPLILKNRFLYNFCGLGLEWRDEMKTNDNRRISLCISQKVFDYLDEKDPKLLYSLAPHIRVFGRFKPTGKARVVEMLQKSSGFVVGYCGDGGNDVAAASQADFGVALIGSMEECDPKNKDSKKKASVLAAPFVSKSRDLLNCLRLIREGRAVLANNLCALRWLLIVNFLFIFVAKIYILVNNGFTHSNYFLFAEAILTPFVAGLLANSKPPKLPGLDIYTHGQQGLAFKKASENGQLWKPTPPLLPGYGPEVRLLTLKNILFLFFGVAIVLSGYILLVVDLRLHGFVVKMDLNTMDLYPLHMPGKGDNTLTSTWIIYCVAGAYIGTLLVLNGGSRFRESSYKNFGLTGFLLFGFLFTITPVITVNSPLNAFWRLNSDQFNFNFYHNNLGKVEVLNQLWDFGRPIFKGDEKAMVAIETEEAFNALANPWSSPPVGLAWSAPKPGAPPTSPPEFTEKVSCKTHVGTSTNSQSFLDLDLGPDTPKELLSNGDTLITNADDAIKAGAAFTCTREGCDEFCMKQWEGTTTKKRCYVAKWTETNQECEISTYPSSPKAFAKDDNVRYLVRHDRLSKRLSSEREFGFEYSETGLFLIIIIGLVFSSLVLLQLLMA